MRFNLIQGEKIVDVKDSIDQLDFSKLKHCDVWSIWAYWDTDCKCVAKVKWTDGINYSFFNSYTSESYTIHKHSRIIPMVKAALNYNALFSPNRIYGVQVYPIGG